MTYSGQAAGWIKKKLGTQVDLGPGHTVLDGDPAPASERGTSAPPTFEIYGRRLCLRPYNQRPMSIVAKRSPISAAAEVLFNNHLTKSIFSSPFLSCAVFRRPFVKRFALCYQTVVCLSVCLSCLSVLSVTLVYCGQTVKRIKMKLGMRVGLGPGHIVLDGTQLVLPKGGLSP